MFPPSQNGPIHIEDDDIEPLTNGPDTVIGYNLGYLPLLPQRGQQITTETVTTIAPTRTIQLLDGPTYSGKFKIRGYNALATTSYEIAI